MAAVCGAVLVSAAAGAASGPRPVQRAEDGTQGTADSAVLHFTLEEAMAYALEHNWDLQNSSLAIRQAEADRWAAIARYAAAGQRNS